MRREAGPAAENCLSCGLLDVHHEECVYSGAFPLLCDAARRLALPGLILLALLRCSVRLKLRAKAKRRQ